VRERERERLGRSHKRTSQGERVGEVGREDVCGGAQQHALIAVRVQDGSDDVTVRPKRC
jgi:hypothetical protein